MPRNGSGVYSAPPATEAVTGEVVSSAKFNTLVTDLVADANNPRPIASGGTGATTVSGIRTALGIIDAIYPVGSIYLSALAANPSTLFPGTTWVALAQGRAIVGVGTSNTAEAMAWTAKQERGLETHTLTTAETPAHSHAPGTLGTSGAGSHRHTFSQAPQSPSLDGNGGTPANWALTSVGTAFTNYAPDHSHTIVGNTSEVGGGDAHNNVQPSIAVHIWERTA